MQNQIEIRGASCWAAQEGRRVYRYRTGSVRFVLRFRIVGSALHLAGNSAFAFDASSTSKNFFWFSCNMADVVFAQAHLPHFFRAPLAEVRTSILARCRWEPELDLQALQQHTIDMQMSTEQATSYREKLANEQSWNPPLLNQATYADWITTTTAARRWCRCTARPGSSRSSNGSGG